MPHDNHVTLITVTYNSAEQISEFWKAPPSTNIEWIVVDNASQDDSAAVAKSLGAKVLRLETNVGFGAACNIGLRNASHPIIGFINPDVTVIYEDLPLLARTVTASGALVAPQLLNSNGTPQPNGRGCPSLPNKIANRLAPARASERGFRLIAAPNETIEATWITGAAIFGERKKLLELGGFDETFFVYYEDIDLCLRARSHGTSSLVVGESRWVHGWARAASGFNVSGWRLEFSSAFKFYRKYPRLAFAK